MNWLPLRAARIQNYKSIADSERLDFNPFTLLIGNNGSGKSSLVEALETLRAIGAESLDDVFLGPRAIEHVLHKGKKKGKLSKDPSLTKQSERLKFWADGRVYGSSADSIKSGSAFSLRCEIAAVNLVEGVRLCNEVVTIKGQYSRYRHEEGLVEIAQQRATHPVSDLTLPPDRSLIEFELGRFISAWQFLALVPEHMGLPQPRRIAHTSRTMLRDASDVAAALHRLSEEHPDVFESIVETMKEILGYGDRLDPRQDLGAIKHRYIELDEKEYTVPGWMLSTGTLRIVALLIALRRPQPPSLLCIEEIENGLDPRTLGLVMDEIKFLTKRRRIQVIATTHSPHLLDQVELDQVLFVQRREGVPHFLRPAESQHVKSFLHQFDPGRLYTMGVLEQAAEELLR